MPKIVDHEERRQEVAEAVLDIIAEGGVGAVTFRKVSKTTGWPVGAINHYFVNRRDLLMAALVRAAQLSAERQLQVVGSRQGVDALATVLHEELPLDRRRLAMSRVFLFFYAEAAADTDIKRTIDSYLKRWRRQISVVVSQAQALGEIDPLLDSDKVAADLVAWVDGLGQHMLFNDDLRRSVARNSPILGWISRLSGGAAPAVLVSARKPK